MTPPTTPLRIALVTETFPPEVNGVARTLRELVRGLAARGHEVLVVRPRQPSDRVARDGAGSDRPATGSEADATDPGWWEELVPGLPIPSYPGLRFGLSARRRLSRIFDRFRPDVVHVATEGLLGLSALGAADRASIPVVSSFHTNFHHYGQFYGYGRLAKPLVRYLRWFHNRTRRTLVPAEDVRAALAIEGFERLDLLSRGVDTKLFDPARRDQALRHHWGAGPRDPVVLWVGRLAKEKNPDLALRGFAELRRLWPGCQTVVVGDGPAGEALRRRDPAVRFCGMRRGIDLARHYASADVLLFPSRTETFGNVLLEGMSSGLAVAAFDYAAARTLVRHGVDGFVAPFGDEESWLQQVRALPALSFERLRRVGAAARARALEQTWGAIVSRFEAVLEEVIVEASFTVEIPDAAARVQEAAPGTVASASL